MRQLILQRIEEIKSQSEGFRRDNMRWNGVRVYDTHISAVYFEGLSDETLLDIFETILVRYYKQM